MKRPKIVLTAVALLTILGGALAVEASRVTDRIWIRKTGETLCNTSIRATLTANDNQLGISFATLIPGQCPLEVPYFTAP